MDKNKKILVIGCISTVVVLIITGVFLYMGNIEINNLEKQYSDLVEERKSLIQETNAYDKALRDENTIEILDTVLSAGKEAASIQTKMMKAEFEGMNPIDAAGSFKMPDASWEKKLKEYFPNEKEYYCNTGWCVAENAKCDFDTVLKYDPVSIPVAWKITVNNRIIALATAKYNVEEKCFVDLEIYKTSFGRTMEDYTYDLMVERAKKEAGISDDEKSDAKQEIDQSDDNERIDVWLPEFDEDGKIIGRKDKKEAE